MKKRSLSEKILCVLLILVILMSGIYFPRGKAEEVATGSETTVTATATEIPSNVTIVTDETEKQKLLGVSNENIRRENLLGIASQFSIFAEENVQFTGADVEGRVAAGGSITATTNYEYQIGWKNENDETADIIVGDGPIENIALTFGADGEGNIIQDDKKVAVSTNATNMNYEDFSDVELSKILAGDLIDFDEEFSYLRKLSGYLTTKGKYQSNNSSYWAIGNLCGIEINDYYGSNVNRFYDYEEVSNGITYYFYGTNKNLNIFNISGDKNSIYNSINNIVFDVPEGSYVILNVDDTEFTLELNVGDRAVYYPASEKEIAQVDHTKEELVYIAKGEQGESRELLKNEEGDYKVFKKIVNGEVYGNNSDELSKKILLNSPNAQKIKLYTFPGSILAPNATLYAENGYYIPGNIICKSYSGNVQIGNLQYDGPLSAEQKYTIDINKIDSITKEKIDDAQLEILDLNRNLLYSWKSGDEILIQLEPGEYILVEKTPGENYEQVLNKESTFTVKGSIDVNESGNFVPSPYITMGAEITETVLTRKSESWVSNSYEFSNLGENESISGIYKTINLPNGNKAVITPCWTITEYDSEDNVLNTYNFGGPGGAYIFDVKVLENGYEFYVSNEGSLWKITYEKGQTSANIQSVSSPTIPSFVDGLSLSEMSTQPTSDNGLIIVGNKYLGTTKTLEIPATETTSGNKITYNAKDRNTTSLFITMKINSVGKIEWANFLEHDVYISGKVQEIDNGYIIYGGTYSGFLRIEASQSKFKREEIYRDFSTQGSYKPVLLQIDKNGKINYSKYITNRQLSNNYGGAYQKFNTITIRDDIMYATLNSHTVKFTKSNFPTTWNNLYAGLENANTVRKLTFNIDASEATTLTEKDLYVIVAENNGKPYIWEEFLSWTNVQDSEQVETDVPIAKEFYPYYAKYDRDRWADNVDIIKFEPHFYRQNLEDPNDTATEVYDIKVNNIQAHYYTVGETTTETYTSQNYVQTNEIQDAIIIQNDHIQTDVTITKTDKDTGAAVAGATYGIYDLNNTLISSEETNANGIAQFKDELLDKGNYYIKEVSSPDGYKLSKETKNFTVTKTGSFTFNVQDEKTKITIEKVDQDNNPLSGAELKVVDMQGTEIAKWTTSTTAKELVGLKVGTYKLTETFTPNGYVKGNDVTFTINELGEIYVDSQKVDKVTIQNSLVKGTINITKTGEVYSNLSIKNNVLSYANYIFNYTPAELSGVTFKLYAADNIVQNGTTIYEKDKWVGTAITNNQGIATFTDLPLGNYYAVEEKALDGYKTDKTHITLGLVYVNDTTPIVYATTPMNNERIKAEIKVDKTIKGTTEKLQGAVFGLYNTNTMYEDIPANTLLSTIITDEKGTGTFDIDLPLGEYYVKELEVPAGYIKSDEVKAVEFIAANLQDDSDKTYNLPFENDYTKLQITKTEINTTTQISGATLQLFDEQGNAILDENGKEYIWETDGTPYTINKLPVGNYVLKEISPAPGYVTAADKPFTLTETAEVQQVNMEDDVTKVQISKTELGSNLAVPVIGATLQIFNQQGIAVLDEQGNAYRWETEETVKNITKLPIGTYVLKEVNTPAGYIKAEDITFEVKDTSEIQEVAMEDDFTKVEISKLDIETKELLSGATLQIVDEQNNPVLDEQGAPYEWISTSQVKVINKLPVGKYKLVETKPASGYIKAADVEFEVVESGKVVPVTMEDDFTKLQVQKLDINLNAVKGAILQIYDENNNLIEEWETNGSVHEINRKLQVGGKYTLVESKVPDGYVKAENVEFTVSETGKIVVNEQIIEKITMIDNFVTGTIKITKTAEVVKGVNKYNGPEGFEQLETYEFEYEEGTLSEVVFELYAAEDIIINGVTKYTKDQLIGEATTDENGIATFENMSLGSYYFVEKSTVDGYELDKKPVSLVLAYESENKPVVYTTTFNNERVTSSIKVTKVDTQTKNALEDVVFGLYTKEEKCGLPANTLLSIIQTNEYGYAEFKTDIPTGKYYVKEIQTIDGYVLLDEIQEIEFNSENNEFEFTFENDFTKVVIKKLNEQGIYVENAKLQIQDLSGNVVEEWTTTDTYHRIERKLLAGKTYKLVELEAPQGYKVAEPIEFTVEEDGTINIVKMVDVEQLVDSNIPQTGDKLDIAFITLLCLTACSLVYNIGKYVWIAKKEKRN